MTTRFEPPRHAVVEAVSRALAEDLTPLGDLTSMLISPDVKAVAAFVPRCDGILAGQACATEAFRQVDESARITWYKVDGEEVAAGETIAEVGGPLASILTAERTALNFLCHLSGIATATRRFVDAAESGGGARIWDTRKTTPGLRALEKAAVRCGGALNHRGNLSDWILLKDNHIAMLGIAEAVRLARSRWPGRTVHIECDTTEQLAEALEAGVDAVLLDNMSPQQVGDCVQMVDDHSKQPGVRRPIVEVSGGMTLETVASYAATGADHISVGAITISAPTLDIGLDVSIG